MPRLHCEVSDDLNKIVKLAKIRGLKTKGRVLKKFIDLAVSSEGEYSGGLPFGDDKVSTATISKFSDEDYDRTENYREKWSLETQKDFFKFALHHGAEIWNKERSR